MVSALSNQSFVSDAERQGLAFICSSMLNSRGLVYQLIVNGEPVNSNLLESMGQMLEYAYLTGNDDLFEEILKLIMENFRTEEGYFSWKITGGRQQKASALIDDLRILKMILRQEEVKENKWQIYKETLLDSLNFSLRDEKWVSYYDGKSRKKSTRIPLFYIDLEVMKKAAEEDQRFKKAYEWAEKILMSASINQFGFFPSFLQL
ncbi:MAG TPA: hypothetical protein DEA47_06225 [Peptococcaceae bacterium]|nr:MAG: Uncharacterized protein XD50_0850 [Clostridia bacterium 41_269]HBT20936.1 hypothetical protein [Peptococcaceae bacterium]